MSTPCPADVAVACHLLSQGVAEVTAAATVTAASDVEDRSHDDGAEGVFAAAVHDATSSSPLRFPCTVHGCCCSFTSSAAFDTHYNSSHRNVCRLCKTTMATPRLLDLHIRCAVASHTQQPPSPHPHLTVSSRPPHARRTIVSPSTSSSPSPSPSTFPPVPGFASLGPECVLATISVANAFCLSSTTCSQ